MTTHYQINGWDTDSLFVRKDKFTQGNLYGCGYGALGQLMNNATTTPQPVSSYQDVTHGSNWIQMAIAGVNLAGAHCSAGIKSDGTLWVCGRNTNGMLGDGTVTNKNSPVQTIAGGTNWKQVATNAISMAGIKTDGTLWTWGDGVAIGDNTIVAKSSPVQTIAGGTNWKQVSMGSSGGNSYVFAVKTDGTLWGWGSNTGGQLGDNTLTNRSSPVQTVAGGTDWKQVSAGSGGGAAIKTDGSLWLWGSNASGTLGDGTVANKSSPVQTVAGGTNWKQVSMASGTSSANCAAIKTDGTLWTWGSNTYGQLGDGTVAAKSSPVQTIAGGTNWKQVSCGNTHIVAIKTDGTIWSWGRNNYNQLMDATTTNRSSPVQVMGTSNWKQVACGYTETLAISAI